MARHLGAPARWKEKNLKRAAPDYLRGPPQGDAFPRRRQARRPVTERTAAEPHSALARMTCVDRRRTAHGMVDGSREEPCRRGARYPSVEDDCAHCSEPRNSMGAFPRTKLAGACSEQGRNDGLQGVASRPYTRFFRRATAWTLTGTRRQQRATNTKYRSRASLQPEQRAMPQARRGKLHCST